MQTWKEGEGGVVGGDAKGRGGGGKIKRGWGGKGGGTFKERMWRDKEKGRSGGDVEGVGAGVGQCEWGRRRRSGGMAKEDEGGREWGRGDEGGRIWGTRGRGKVSRGGGVAREG